MFENSSLKTNPNAFVSAEVFADLEAKGVVVDIKRRVVIVGGQNSNGFFALAERDLKNSLKRIVVIIISWTSITLLIALGLVTCLCLFTSMPFREFFDTFRILFPVVFVASTFVTWGYSWEEFLFVTFFISDWTDVVKLWKGDDLHFFFHLASPHGRTMEYDCLQ